jgi:hypothetical protein
MRLQALAGGQSGVDWRDISADRDLATDVQGALIRLGFLDGPPDGRFGPVSQWALSAFVDSNAQDAPRLSPALAHSLLSAKPLPFQPGADLAGRIARTMHGLGYFMVRYPACINIVYVEGIDDTGKANGNPPNAFNDLRVILRFDPNGRPAIKTWEATTEPGRTYTEAPLETTGAARIAFNQFKAWSVGTHPRAGGHVALVQVADIDVHRDLNRDYRRDGDLVYRGPFGINQHWGYDNPATDIKKASAGCLVGRTTAGHIEFMDQVRADPRYQSSHGYRFHTAVLDGTKLGGA